MSKIAVHLHLFYTDQLEDFIRRLTSFGNIAYDLYVTVIEDNEDIKARIYEFKPDAKIWVVDNLGYDVGPFIDFLHKINLDDYDYVLKIHTKRAPKNVYTFNKERRFNMKLWREVLLDALLSSHRAIENNLKLLANNPNIGMIGSKYLLVENNIKSIDKKIEAEMTKLGLGIPQNKLFISGTMFWVRASLMKPFLYYNLEDFSVSESHIHDDTLAHVLERVFGLSVISAGYHIYGVTYKLFYFDFAKLFLSRFLYQKKITKSGYEIIKICKIPIFHRKEKQ